MMGMISTMLRLLVLCCTLALLVAGTSGCASVRYEDYSKLGNPRKEEFVIGIADVIRVAVWKMSDVNTEVKVRPDGNITVPLIGEIKAAGRTPTQLQQEIQAKLKTYVKDEGATVTVAVVEVNSYAITVSGKVTRPGMFHLKNYVTVSEAIALAGGPTIYASLDDVVVIRTWKSTTNKPKRIPVQYSKIQEGLAPEQDLVLYTGDTVFVP
jgi:polysaccharide biosynthesis/export protein